VTFSKEWIHNSTMTSAPEESLLARIFCNPKLAALQAVTPFASAVAEDAFAGFAPDDLYDG
jgi:hypothetical protein